MTNGRADVDLDGDGFADDPQALEIDQAELEQLASGYSAGQELWRVSTPHFLRWDFN